jgi:hypothetical protein
LEKHAKRVKILLPIFFENCLQSIKECQFSTALVFVLDIYVNLTAELNKLMKERFPQIETDQNSLIHARVERVASTIRGQILVVETSLTFWKWQPGSK